MSKSQKSASRSLGIVRNKTQILLLIKASHKKKSSRFSKLNIMGDQQLQYEMKSMVRKPLNLDSDAETDGDSSANRNFSGNGNSSSQNTTSTNASSSTKEHSLPPEWVDNYEQCRYLLSEINEIKRQMMGFQTKRFTCIHTADEKQLDMQIYECASKATKKIKKCEKLLEKIKHHSDNSQDRSKQSDKQSSSNVAYKLAEELREKTREIRAQQRAFMEQRKNLQQSSKASFLEMAAEMMLRDDQADEQTMMQEEEDFQQLEQRDQEISKIIESIHDLNLLYKELNSMVILQGSLLDRIDFNIEEAHKNIEEGEEHVEKAQKYQKKTSNCACKTMVVILVGIVILGIVLFVKWSKK